MESETYLRCRDRANELFDELSEDINPGELMIVIAILMGVVFANTKEIKDVDGAVEATSNMVRVALAAFCQMKDLDAEIKIELLQQQGETQ